MLHVLQDRERPALSIWRNLSGMRSKGLVGVKPQDRMLLPTVLQGKYSILLPPCEHTCHRTNAACLGWEQGANMPFCKAAVITSACTLHSLYPFNSFAGRLGRATVSTDTGPKVIGKVLEDSIQTAGYLLLL